MCPGQADQKERSARYLGYRPRFQVLLLKRSEDPRSVAQIPECRYPEPSEQIFYLGPRISLLISLHSGFICSIRASFHFRFHHFSCRSLLRASR
jgi:hypothetical protein